MVVQGRFRVHIVHGIAWPAEAIPSSKNTLEIVTCNIVDPVVSSPLLAYSCHLQTLETFNFLKLKAS